jgi:hypothetical protein
VPFSPNLYEKARKAFDDHLVKIIARKTIDSHGPFEQITTANFSPSCPQFTQRQSSQQGLNLFARPEKPEQPAGRDGSTIKNRVIELNLYYFVGGNADVQQNPHCPDLKRVTQFVLPEFSMGHSGGLFWRVE